mmetsp:Transcript_4512/g.10205  ORF Transcript_4512/g.10205 Transcript_4512/m.10205 type:complete len:289 (+) Transcript_4512:3947-4813(+)
MAVPKSPPASVRALLQSIIPAPVCCLSLFTSCAVIIRLSDYEPCCLCLTDSYLGTSAVLISLALVIIKDGASVSSAALIDLVPTVGVTFLTSFLVLVLVLLGRACFVASIASTGFVSNVVVTSASACCRSSTALVIVTGVLVMFSTKVDCCPKASEEVIFSTFLVLEPLPTFVACSGIAEVSVFFFRSANPSSIALPIALIISSIEREASSLLGIGWSIQLGSVLVSVRANTGISSFLASLTAMCSFLISTTQSAAGSLVTSAIPYNNRSSFAFSRAIISCSFLAMFW